MKYNNISTSSYFTISVAFMFLYIIFQLIMKYGSTVNKYIICNGPKCKEGFSETSSPSYSHTVDLPLTTTISCNNFCGPQSKCAITGTQCTSDVDCSGCQPPDYKRPQCNDNNYQPYTYDMKDYAYLSPNHKYVEIQKGYEGEDRWTQSFNKGLELYNRKMKANYPLDEYAEKYLPKYQTTISATGTFYETTPPGYNCLD